MMKYENVFSEGNPGTFCKYLYEYAHVLLCMGSILFFKERWKSTSVNTEFSILLIYLHKFWENPGLF